MHFPKRYLVLLSLTAAISLLTVGCTESKVSQCNKIIEVANKAASQATSVTKDGQATDPKTMRQAADAMEKASQEMKVIEVKDQKLKDYQAGFVNMYRNTSKATRDFVTAFEKKDRTGAETAATSFQQAITSEKQLVTNLNTYCSGK